jgi:hypothetical protein
LGICQLRVSFTYGFTNKIANVNEPLSLKSQWLNLGENLVFSSCLDSQDFAGIVNPRD